METLIINDNLHAKFFAEEKEITLYEEYSIISLNKSDLEKLIPWLQSKITEF